MLRQRVVTAVLLLAVLLPTLFWPAPQPFAAVVLLLLAVGAWEWGRLNGLASAPAVGCAVACLLLCAGSWRAGWIAASLPLLWTVAGAAWVLGGALVLRRGVAGWGTVPRWLRLAGGIAALWLAWLAVAQARIRGIEFLLSAFVLVWVADVAAYFAGRAFGMRLARVRLAPGISPGKSWEGVWGGMVAVLAIAALWIQADRAGMGAGHSLYTLLADRGLAVLVVGLVFLAAMSVVGDLVESLVKRSAGMKDSSGLLPGHGGVLDRVDALLPVLPLAMMLSSF
jgi:phosphatidate cytidylyltransferase